MSRAWEAQLHRVHEVRSGLPCEITHRPMFGGAMLYADGRPVASLSEAGLAVKLPKSRQDNLLDVPGAHRLRHHATSPESRTYIVLPPDLVDDDDQLLTWLALAAEHAAPRPGVDP